MYLYESLSHDNYLVVNKTLIKIFGINGSLFISELFYRRKLYAESGKLTEDGFFYATVNDIEKETTLSEYQQNQILTVLQNEGLVKVEKRGLPAKRHIFIDAQAFEIYLNRYTYVHQSVTPVTEKFSHKNLNNSGLINNNIINNKSSSISKDTDDDQAVFTARSSKNSNSLFSSPKIKTKGQSIQKINTFIRNCENELIVRRYPNHISEALKTYFRMLGESNTLLPLTTIQSQLNYLDELSDEKKLQAILETIQHGWKSLTYKIDELKTSKKPSFDTAKNSQVQLKSEEEKQRDIVAEARARGEEIF